MKLSEEEIHKLSLMRRPIVNKPLGIAYGTRVEAAGRMNFFIGGGAGGVARYSFFLFDQSVMGVTDRLTVAIEQAAPAASHSGKVPRGPIS